MKKKKILKALLWTTVALVTLLALGYAAIDWAGARAWKKMEAELRAKGEPTELAQFIPPPVPDDQNFAYSDFLQGVLEEEKKAAKNSQYRELYQLPRSDIERDFPDLRQTRPVDLATWQTYFRSLPEFELSATQQDPAEDVILALSHWKVPLDQIARELRERPFMRPPLKYAEGVAVDMAYLNPLFRSVKVFQIRAIAYLRKGEGAAALHDLRTIFLLRDACQPRRSLLHRILGATIESVALPILREGLAAQTWNDAELQEVSAIFQQMTPLEDTRQALRNERLIVLITTKRQIIERHAVFSSDSTETRIARFAFLYLPKGIWQLDRVVYCRIIQQIMDDILKPASGRVNVAAYRVLDREIKRYISHPATFLYLFTTWIQPTLETSQDTGMLVAYQSEALIAIALERHRLAQGHLPDRLEALVPAYLPEIPIDPIDGRPVRYQKIAPDAYRLWTVGRNEKDEDGIISNDSPYSGDWVWASLPAPKK